jgi:branched-chain amino acid transport system permease protein
MRQFGRFWWVAALLFLAAFPLTFGRAAPYRTGVLVFVGIYVILAVSLDLLMGYAGQISVGHAAFFAVGAYASGILTTKYGWAPMAALAAGVVLSALLAWGVGRPVLALKEYYLAMATLALNEIIVTLIVGLQGLTGGASGLRDIPSFHAFGLSFESPERFYYLVWSAATLVMAASLAIVRSPFGRALTAVHSDETAARTFGVDCASHKLRVYVVSAAFASLAGSLFAHQMGFLAPDDFGVLTSVNLVVMLFLGGVGTIFGPALGAVFLKLLPEATYGFHDYELLTNGAILIAVLLFMPRGLWGAAKALVARIGAGDPR